MTTMFLSFAPVSAAVATIVFAFCVKTTAHVAHYETVIVDVDGTERKMKS